MTDSEMNIALAEFEGWTKGPNGWCEKTANGIAWFCCKSPTGEYKWIDDYGSSLDACHRVECKLTEQQQADFVDALFHNLPCDQNHGPIADDGPDIMTPSMFAQIHATAPQRREALCRTLWPERWSERREA